MWKAENRQRYNRDKLRYPSDLTDKQWSSDPSGEARRATACRATIRVRIPVNQDEKLSGAWGEGRA
jgi:hypothetical protein